MIQNNPGIRKLWPPWASMQGVSRPLSYFTFALNYAVHGSRVWGYHLVNLAIHLAAALALYGVVRRTLRCNRLTGRYAAAAPYLALSVALLWTVHPLQTQSVTYVYQRQESLMGLSYLLTLYAFIRTRDSVRPHAWLALSWLCCVLGAATKEVMVTAPIMVMWYDRVFVAGSWRELCRARWGYYLALASTWLLTFALLMSIRDTLASAGLLEVQAKYDASGAVILEPMTAREYARSQPAVILHYLRLCFWPQGQCLEPVRPIATAADEIVPPLLAILAMLGATAWCVFRRPTWGFLGGWFFVILAPTSSIAPIVNLEFEHRMYLSLAAVAVAVVVAAHKALLWLASRSSVFRIARHRLAAMVLTIAVAILGCTTYARNEAYCSEMAIWQDVIEHSPLPNYHAFHAVGRGLSAHGDQSAAIACYRQALRIFEDQVVWNDLGRAYMRLGERDKACGCYERALEIAPKLVSANVNLAILLRDEAPHEAIRHCRMAIETAPDNAEAHDALASLLQQQKQFDEAMDHYRLAVTCDPEFAAPHSNLGGLLARLGRFDEAVAEFETTLVMDPDFPTAQCNLDLARRLLATQRNARGAETGPASAAGSPSRR